MKGGCDHDLVYCILAYWCSCKLDWIGLVIYIKNRTAWTWKGFFEVAKATMRSPVIEVLKWFLFVIAWPVETAVVVYQVLYEKLLAKRLINNLSKLGL